MTNVVLKGPCPLCGVAIMTALDENGKPAPGTVPGVEAVAVENAKLKAELDAARLELAEENKLHREACDHVSRLHDQVSMLNGVHAFVDQLAEHGTGFDTNPTVAFKTTEELWATLVHYIGSIDERIRERAKEALNGVTGDNYRKLYEKAERWILKYREVLHTIAHAENEEELHKLVAEAKEKYQL